MKPEVLVWGLSGDAPTDSVLHALAASNIPHRFLDQRKLQSARLVIGADPRVGQLHMGRGVIALEDIGAIYARPADIRLVLPQAGNDVLTLDHQLYAWMEITDARVVNRPSAAWSNDSKPHQAERIRANGFAVPPTLVTTTPAAAREFIERHGQVVCKAVGRTRTLVTRFDAASLDGLEDVAHCPTHFQAYVPGVDWRVHVIGSEVHACEIRCEADDYRVAPEEGVAIEVSAAMLPESIATRCRSLASDLNLALAGIDLRLGRDGVWYCFEVNPSPALTWYEKAAGQPLAAAVARLLGDAL